MKILDFADLHIPQESRIEVDPATEAAREAALRSLSSVGRSRNSLQERLVERGHELEVLVPLLDRFEEVGLLNDRELASAIARARFTERGRSRRAIANELERKGFDELDIEEALSQIDEEDEIETVRALARKRLAKDSKGQRQDRIRRAVGHLCRKGYSQGMAMKCIMEVLHQEDADTAV